MRLIVAGDGPAMPALRERARNSTTTLLGFVDDARVASLMGDAIAAIVPGEEDLGLVPIEAAAAGRPSIAYRGGGARETVIEGVTGEFFDTAHPEALAAALRGFDAARYDPALLRAHAERFSPAALRRPFPRDRGADARVIARMPVYDERRHVFARVHGERVLIYWPHGFGDFVHFGYVLPLLEAEQHLRDRALRR